MRIFLGITVATAVNFLLGLVGFQVVSNSLLLSFSPEISTEISSINYLSSFTLKYLVITVLTWIMFKVMPLLDKPRKRILFIFLLGSAFTVYNEINLFWAGTSFNWSIVMVIGESLNWLVTGYVLSRFIKPKHIGAQ
ncbi:MAG: hypothetical protein ACJ0G1_01265 [Gammaproteobacteria bacterium]|tara:strand:+ start:1383 stop:1793 length:411 start_codon:yes stop_codon:yes gene_type:complete